MGWKGEFSAVSSNLAHALLVKPRWVRLQLARGRLHCHVLLCAPARALPFKDRDWAGCGLFKQQCVPCSTASVASNRLTVPSSLRPDWMSGQDRDSVLQSCRM